MPSDVYPLNPQACKAPRRCAYACTCARHVFTTRLYNARLRGGCVPPLCLCICMPRRLCTPEGVARRSCRLGGELGLRVEEGEDEEDEAVGGSDEE